MRKTRILFLLPFATCVFLNANAQAPTPLQVGTPIERTLGPSQSQVFTITLEENTFVQLVVEQRGIDVVVRVTSPAAKSIGEYDSPNGNEGPEHVSFVGTAAGAYRINVSPLYSEGAPGHFEIKVLEVRPANEQEIKASKNQEAAKAKAIAMLVEMDGLIAQIKSPLTRIRAQLQAAQLLWDSDEKRASKYFADATTGFKDYLASLDANDENYPQQYQSLTELRYQVIQILADRDPDAALSFLYSSKPPANPNETERYNSSQEGMIELAIANQISRTDPNRALQIARQSLKTHFSTNLVSTVGALRLKNPELATQFASEIASKLMSDKLLTNPEAASVAMNLLRLGQQQSNGSVLSPNGPRIAILPDEQYRELLQKALSEALAYSHRPSPQYNPERDAAMNLLYGLQQFGSELDTVSGGATAAVIKKIAELSNQDPAAMDQYQKVIGDNPADTALETIEKTPVDQREQLYIQLAGREANNGDAARARQIINQRVTNPYQRRNALANIDQQEINRLMRKGKVDEALRIIGGVPTARQRAVFIAQIAAQIGPGQKRASAMNLLEQAKSLLGQSVPAQDQVQFLALVEIARAFGKYDVKRSFEILDPLIDQVNDLCTAARTLEGFGPQSYDADEELNLQNGGSVPQAAIQVANALGTLAVANFERARAASDRFRLPEVRLRAYLEIAQQTIPANADSRR
ncbi:MAG TPA: PPC domain-containing protein [Pyrinomonadaceae bacterium]|nr:PPC domain-containing protein [Pyrinomonadaceae bacterium]